MRHFSIHLIACAAIGLFGYQAHARVDEEVNKLVLSYDTPATNWDKEALPLGNGWLGCMIFGGIEQEHIQFNVDSLWLGSESDTGSYQSFGDIIMDLGAASATDYHRELDISRALQTITYSSKGTRYKRESFSSAPAEVMVFRFTADQTAAHSGRITLSDAHQAPITVEGNRISAIGDTNGKWDKRVKGSNIVLNYEAQVWVLHEGGRIQAVENGIEFEGCDSLTILVSAGTDYLNQRDKGWKQAHPHQRITDSLTQASQQTFEQLKQAHIKDYQALFNRVSIEVGNTPEPIKSLPLPERLDRYRGSNSMKKPNLSKGAADPDLEELMFQYARYLLISSSRPGSLPANLQGLWNNSNSPPWRSDYHSDVNLQMNYWFADQANLSDCFSPFAEWYHSIREVRREETQEHFGKRGIAMHAENGIFGGSTWKWSIGDASWLANNLWDHYAYTQDLQYLKTRAYPIMKDLFMFWEDHLKEIPAPDGNGTVLVAPDGFSPEHGPHEDGVSFDQQLAYDLLTNFAEASEILGVDASERAKARTMRDHLLGPQIGRWGQLQEWMVDRDKQNDKHRHLSHLIAVHPGRQISPHTTPLLAEAARVSMNARGDGSTGWSKAWKINIWARLLDGNRAHKLLREMMAGNVHSNLFNMHPPFQIDGNFGYASGVCEMLIQSHMDAIHLLPALPDAWKSGQVIGLRARGGFEVSLKWTDGQLEAAIIRSEQGKVCRLRSATPLYVTQNGRKIETVVTDRGTIEFPTLRGVEYTITTTHHNL
ncbi:glycoside hydrolase family 95 protein [Coraliomargarita sp. SDUM461003]|uniref:Glycoside hydrolase family 95 protein n=1 Tax=Thalassobacterium maritimum TaxID=3041265 RepID=A0ABU1AQH1_9BACT|nr:glycoside hydrolase family 95 protein [Coraliomargarita sp. SDUM461003]MDQ8206383.1 glycoside hydrolase family 95 protein [Coraliomargarita sp. SDUM461003]